MSVLIRFVFQVFLFAALFANPAFSKIVTSGQPNTVLTNQMKITGTAPGNETGGIGRIFSWRNLTLGVLSLYSCALGACTSKPVEVGVPFTIERGKAVQIADANGSYARKFNQEASCPISDGIVTEGFDAMSEIDRAETWSVFGYADDYYTLRHYCPKETPDGKLTFGPAHSSTQIRLSDQFTRYFTPMNNYLLREYNWYESYQYPRTGHRPKDYIDSYHDFYRNDWYSEIINKVVMDKFDSATLLFDKNGDPINGFTYTSGVAKGIKVSYDYVEEEDVYENDVKVGKRDVEKTATVFEQYMISTLQTSYTYVDASGRRQEGFVKAPIKQVDLFDQFFPRSGINYRSAYGNQIIPGMGQMASRFRIGNEEITIAEMMLTKANYGNWSYNGYRGFYPDMENLVGNVLDDQVFVIQDGLHAYVFVMENISKPGDREPTFAPAKLYSVIDGFFVGINVEAGNIKMDWGDPNGDGHLDLIAERQYGNQVFVRVGVHIGPNEFAIAGEAEDEIPKDEVATWNFSNVKKFDSVIVVKGEKRTAMILVTKGKDGFVYIPYFFKLDHIETKW